VAVWAKHSQVFKPVVIPHAIYMIQVHVKRLSLPCGEPAGAAHVFQQTGRHEAHFDVFAISFCAGKQLRNRHAEFSRHDFPATHRICPRPRAKPEPFLALPIAMARVVVPLNLYPIVFSAPIWKQRRWHSKSIPLYRLNPRRMAKSKQVRALNESMSRIIIFLNRLPVVQLSCHAKIFRYHGAKRVAFRYGKQRTLGHKRHPQPTLFAARIYCQPKTTKPLPIAVFQPRQNRTLPAFDSAHDDPPPPPPPGLAKGSDIMEGAPPLPP
jgi:hypothetical protein